MTDLAGLRVAYHDSSSLEDHVAAIKRQVDRSLADQETIYLATRIVSGAVDWAVDPGSNRSVPVVEAWGRHYPVSTRATCKARDNNCEIAAIWDFVVLNVRYVGDPVNIDTFRTARETLRNGGGDCDDFAIIFAALCGAVGFQVAARVISTDGKYWEHIYPLIGMPKEGVRGWLPLDATVDGANPGWEFSPKKRRAFRDFVLV